MPLLRLPSGGRHALRVVRQHARLVAAEEEAEREGGESEGEGSGEIASA